MDKLTKTQQRVIEVIRQKIIFARKHTIEEWGMKECLFCTDLENYNPVKMWESFKYTSKEEAIEKAKKEIHDYVKEHIDRYIDEIDGIVIVQEDSRVLKSLEKIGLIEIIKDGRGKEDKIKLLNY